VPTPRGGYLRDGRKLPGVTTILKQEDQGGLVAAANKLGLKGRAIYGPSGEWSLAADIGTATHARIQANIEDKEPDFGDLPEKVLEASRLPFCAFLQWCIDKEPNFKGGECEVGLVHPTLPFGGTIDYLHREQGIILDWKTNYSFDYPDKLYGQIGAYTLLAEAHGIPIKSTTVVRFPKDGGDAEELVIDPNGAKGQAGRKLFLSLLEAWEQRYIIGLKEIEPGLMAKVNGGRR